MSNYQVVEKEDIAVDWQMVRYYDRALERFTTEEDASKAAIEYVTDRNCNNALTKAEKLSAAETFMMDEKGVFLGILDGDAWYMTYPKDGPLNKKQSESERKPIYLKGDIVQDKKYFALEGKTEVAVRPVPGT